MGLDIAKSNVTCAEAMLALDEGKAIRRRCWVKEGDLQWQLLYVKIPAYGLQPGFKNFVHDIASVAATLQGDLKKLGKDANDPAFGLIQVTNDVVGKTHEAAAHAHIALRPALHSGLLGTDGVIGPNDWDWHPNKDDEAATDWEITS